MSTKIDTEVLRNLLAKCPQWPADKLPDGDGYYDCPVCNGDGSVDNDLVHGRSSSVWAGGFQFYGCGDEFRALEAVVLQAIDALPALIDGYEERDVYAAGVSMLKKERDDERARADKAQAERDEALAEVARLKELSLILDDVRRHVEGDTYGPLGFIWRRILTMEASAEWERNGLESLCSKDAFIEARLVPNGFVP